MSSAPGKLPSSALRYVLFALPFALALIAGALWWWLRPTPTLDEKPAPSLDMAAAERANNLGIGAMEQFQFTDAVEFFRKVANAYPQWKVARINLGIALMNVNTPASLEEAAAIFERVLGEQREGSDDLYAHFCLGLICSAQNRVDEAIQHFELVTRDDPDDAHAWYQLGQMLDRANQDPERTIQCLKTALRLDPYLSGAMYTLQLQLRRQNRTLEADTVLKEQLALTTRGVENATALKYGMMGRYAEVMDLGEDTPTGPLPTFRRSDRLQIKLRPGARWASTADLQKEPHGELRVRLRERFGSVMVVLDYNRDGLPDLFLVGAVIKDGRLHNLLLRNDGNGSFTDVTAEANLDQPSFGAGCCVADFDNDGFPDLLVTGIGEQRLYRNTGKGTFEDVTTQAGLDQLKTLCLGATFVDLDQDGDLDLVIAQYAALEDAVAVLDGKGEPRGAGLAVFENIGEAAPAKTGQKAPALSVRFQRLDKPPALIGESVPAVGVAAADVDYDRDLDLLILADRAPPALVLNDRLLRFHRAVLPPTLLGGAPVRWNGALVIDGFHLLLISPDRTPVFLVGTAGAGRGDVSKWFDDEATDSPALVQAQAIDIDRDGEPEIVGLSSATPRKPVLVHREGLAWVRVPNAFGSDGAWPRDLLAVSVATFQGDCLPHLMVWSEAEGLQLYESEPNGNHALVLELTGDRSGPRRTNAEGFGSFVEARAGRVSGHGVLTTRSAGLGQSLQPLLLGLGRHEQADVVRLLWPDSTMQAEVNQPACKLLRLEQSDRRPSSCPVLFTWDGQRYVFITDFLGAGSLGEEQPGGGYRTPRPEESIKIESDQLAPLHGDYVLKVTEPMQEVTYLDRARLLVVDHPADVQVFPDERFVPSGPPASQELLAFRRPIFPIKARNQRGHDIRPKILARDRDMVDGFAKRQWPGLAEEHWVELDFGDQLRALNKGRLFLFLAGWTDYAYPETLFAAERAGFAVLSPVLEQRGPDGQWQVLLEAGFPAGLPRMMTLDVSGKLLDTDHCVLRLRTNMEVYWDQIYAAPLLKASSAVHQTELDVKAATLGVRGFQEERSPDGRRPTIYEYDRVTPAPRSLMTGKLTRLGDVTELLRQLDDRFVIFGPGDEVTLRFDADRLPPLKEGWRRSFVLRTWGYCKDPGTFTATGHTVGPLPFRAMRTYPYAADERYPHPDDESTMHTRSLGARR